MKRANDRIGEVIRFVITGGVCFAIEFLCLVLLKERFGLDTLIATPIAFLVSVVANYYLCVRWVFQDAKAPKNAAKAGFLVTSVTGLFLNELLMYLFRIAWGEDTVLFTVFSLTVTLYMLNKVLSTLIVMVWNYFTKRHILKRSAT